MAAAEAVHAPANAQAEPQTASLAESRLAQAPPGAPMLLWLSFAPTPPSAFGGTVHALPAATQFLLAANGLGSLQPRLRAERDDALIVPPA